MELSSKFIDYTEIKLDLERFVIFSSSADVIDIYITEGKYNTGS